MKESQETQKSTFPLPLCLSFLSVGLGEQLWNKELEIEKHYEISRIK